MKKPNIQIVFIGEGPSETTRVEVEPNLPNVRIDVIDDQTNEHIILYYTKATALALSGELTRAAMEVTFEEE